MDARQPPRIVVDASVVCKWRLLAEPYADEATEILLDWRAGVISLGAPDLLHAEVVGAFSRAVRRGRIADTDAVAAIQTLLALPIALSPVQPLALRAFAMAQAHNQSPYDCLYVALAEREGAELWTGDERLYNALHPNLTFVRFIRDYTPRRPTPAAS